MEPELRAEHAGRITNPHAERSIIDSHDSDSSGTCRKFDKDAPITEQNSSDSSREFDNGAPILEQHSGDNSRKLVLKNLAGTADSTWFRGVNTHQDVVNIASKTPEKGHITRRSQRALATAEVQATSFVPWPRRSTDPPSPPPPKITDELVRMIEIQDKFAHPDKPLPPAAQSFVNDLEKWRMQLAHHFQHSTTSFQDNMRRAAGRIRQRLSFLPRERLERIMTIIEEGYTIPFSSEPPPFHRLTNSPDLSLFKTAAWKALLKDISHGAAMPCNLARDGKPKVVSPVRTAPKGWRSDERRFVVNMRYLNQFIPDKLAKCKLDTQPRVRNIYFFPANTLDDPYGFTMDLSSGYHNVGINCKQHTYMGIVIHRSELPAEAIDYLRSMYPYCEDKTTGLFYFVMTALPFGLSPSCAVFSDIITALCAAWRRHKVLSHPVRLTSYVDDKLSVMLGVRRSLITSVELVYEASAAGLTLQVPKCRLAPATIVLYLGTIVNMVTKRFSLPQKRIERIQIQTRELHHSATHYDIIEARQVAQFIGLLWSASPTCPRGVSIMARGLIQMLTSALRNTVYDPVSAQRMHGGDGSAGTSLLRRILATFWDGTVPWTAQAREDIRFWSTVDYASLSAPISADTMELAARGAHIDTSRINTSGVAFIASDASEVACGGGRVVPVGRRSFRYDPTTRFVSELPRRFVGHSSTVREANTVLWLLYSLLPSLPARVIAFTDSLSACNALSRGSRVPEIQAIVREIFVVCLWHNITLIPCWMPRSHAVIQEADRLSRIRDVYGDRTPAPVFAVAQQLAIETWGLPISFDRQASHLNVMPPEGQGPALPFNSRWLQPGSAGVDMFLQPLASWARHINFIHPAAPTLARVVTFLPRTYSRSIVVSPINLVRNQWWSSWVTPGSPGVVTTTSVDSFFVVVLDYSLRSDNPLCAERWAHTCHTRMRAAYPILHHAMCTHTHYEVIFLNAFLRTPRD